MAVLNVEVPDAMKAWVEERAREGRYSDAGDFMRALVRREQERAQKIAAMQALVDEALASGDGTMTIEEIIAAAEEADDRDP